jgi:hypothetical protein
MHGSSLAAYKEVFFSCHKIFKTASFIKTKRRRLELFCFEVQNSKREREVLMHQEKNEGHNRGWLRGNHTHTLWAVRAWNCKSCRVAMTGWKQRGANSASQKRKLLSEFCLMQSSSGSGALCTKSADEESKTNQSFCARGPNFFWGERAANKLAVCAICCCQSRPIFCYDFTSPPPRFSVYSLGCKEWVEPPEGDPDEAGESVLFAKIMERNKKH